MKALNRYVELALQRGFPVLVVHQTGYVLPHVAERRMVAKYLPAEHGQRS